MFKLGVPLLSLIRLSLIIMILCGFIYPVAMTGIAQVTMYEKANGSILYDEEKKPIGSLFIGQSFTDPQFFHGRISSIEFDGRNSGSENYSLSNSELLERIDSALVEWETSNPTTPANEVPIDLLTNSASGLDPHITPEAAIVQVSRISEAIQVEEWQLIELVEGHTEGRDLGVFGAERVNVLQLNLSLLELVDGSGSYGKLDEL
ncbi:potassium-transporting ATPase subunit KdpC [Paenalkalicoccus suaedae]|uniref:Potassium-transporting ATPase KdpC subunit n=1 Tax=Paenalkalicoccus suaedae TaxID=2592382 RepID=A0A859FAB3_9BACI|nr:potassium-transporting ATPase subunit KdpC [Paenalkalicoccus suaedae]QKS69867.1 potassium-transporting ATPase subunit KdpC [Paenalkalicoccus suaedae]